MTTTTVIQIDKSDYEEVTARMEKVVSTFENLIAAQSHKQIPETGGIELAVQVLGKSKSWIYKMIPLLPHKKFGNSLIFSRLELESWLSDNLTDPLEQQEIINSALVASATRRLEKN